MSEHTKTPWSFRRIEARDYGECQYSLTHNGDPFVCVGTCITREKDARHIVHCANNHERLVTMLNKMIDNPTSADWQKARALLAALEAEKGGEL